MLPVADVDRAKAFYQGLGWRLDIDFEPGPGTRGGAVHPAGSPASIHFGHSATKMEPGSLDGMILVVEDIAAARDELIGRGADVSEIWHVEPDKGRVRGPTRSAGRTPAGRPSRTPTATSGSCRRSPSGSRGG